MKFLLLFLFLNVFGSVMAQNNNYFQFSSLPNLPPNSGYLVQPGLAGSYTGIDDDVLIVAGGANFPDKLPWEGGEKVFYDEIFILRTNSTGDYSWEKADEKIPFTAGYGGAVETPNGLLCFGGNTKDKTVSESWFVNYVPKKETVEVTAGPKLPVALTNFAFTKVDNRIFVAGVTPPISC